MCGRAAQSQGAVRQAAAGLGFRVANNSRTLPSNNHRNNNNNNNNNGSSSTNTNPSSSTTTTTTTTKQQQSSPDDNNNNNDNVARKIIVDDNNIFNEFPNEWQDNYNMSPGMDAMVFWNDNGKIQMSKMAWGLVMKNGTVNNPLPEPKERMKLHFSNLMFNARSDTLYTKPTFSRLAANGRSCLVALDGYFEWKVKKEPYFVHCKQTEQKATRIDGGDDDDGNDNNKEVASEISSYLLFAGLWNKVPTGRAKEPYLYTFTLLTTEPCKSISWLHHRMPLCIWNTSVAKDWLETPTQDVLEVMDEQAKKYDDGFDWHKVTPDMGSLKYRDKAAIKPLPKPRTITSFFSKPAKATKGSSGNDNNSDKPTNNNNGNGAKRPFTNHSSLGGSATTSQNKRIKKPTSTSTTTTSTTNKGKITSYFSH